jgi:hypothetical protein
VFVLTEQLEKLLQNEKQPNPRKRGTDIMKTPLKMTLLSATLMALLLPAVAQTANGPSQNGAVPAQTTTPVQGTTPAQATPPESIAQHKQNQQTRIANGVSSGQLTAGEAGTLEKQESNINKEETNMRKADDGNLTAADRAALRQQQNQVSHEIHTDRHNANVQNTNPQGEIGKKAENQQDRIAQGIKSGQLSAGQTANLENKEAAINKEVVQDRKADGGSLTPQQRAQVNRQQNNVSKQIYKDKHAPKHP